MTKNNESNEPTWVEVRPTSSERRGTAFVSGVIGVAGASAGWLAGVGVESLVGNTSFRDNLAEVGALAAVSTVAAGVVSAVFGIRRD